MEGGLIDKVTHAGKNPATDSDRVKASVASADPTDCGRGQNKDRSGKPQTAAKNRGDDLRQRMDGKEGEELRTPTGVEVENEAFVFGRSKQTPRSPEVPRRKVSSSTQSTPRANPEIHIEGTSPEETVTEDGKRKRKAVETEEDGGDGDAEFLQLTIQSILRGVKELKGLVDVSTNTKREITSKVTSLKIQAERLNSDRVISLLERMSRKGKAAKMEGKAVNEKVEVGTSMDKTILKSTTTQTESWRKPAPVRKEYVSTEVKEGNPLITAEPDQDLAVFRRKEDPRMLLGIQKQFKEKYGPIDEIDGPIGHVRIITHVMSGKDPMQKERHVLRIDEGVDMAENKKALESVKGILVGGNRTKLAIAWDVTSSLGELRDTVEDVMRDTGIKTTIHVPSMKNIGVRMEERKGQRFTETEAIFVKVDKETSYADRLKSVREEVIAKGLEANIRGVRKTQGGELMITLSKKGDNERIKEALTGKMGKSNVRMRRSGPDGVIVHVKDIDAITTKKEIEDAFRLELRDLKAERKIRVTSLRTAYAGTQNATVVMDKEAAEEILKRTHLKIGLPNCRIKRNVVVHTCYRCWEIGHAVKDCKGPDRRKCCRNCGEEGHLKQDCKQASKCLICNKPGHPANTTRCPKYRAAIRDEGGHGKEWALRGGPGKA